ncbi:MAG TPA: HAMP domain-containing sensor histidine kinase [Thermoanaerobaculia bacterium]|nr:HAMP domain-containing sensor histidine kinase [Thermoanaerobaculia bacterium]
MSDSDVPAALRTEPEPSVRPLRTALVVGGGYGVLALAWIFASTELAAESASSLEDLRRWEWLKGAGFVVTTALLVALVVYLLLRRIRLQQEVIVSQLHALMRAESVVVTGMVASSVSHDLNNALQVAMASAEMMRDPTGARRREQEQLEQSLDLVASLTRRLGRAGEALGGSAAEFDVVDALETVIEGIRSHPHLAGRQLELSTVGAIRMRGVRQLVTRATLNLVLNAAEAAGPDAHVVVTAAVGDGSLVLTVEDDGPGVPFQLRERIFHPFFSTKPCGHGLGLLSVMACVERHGGRARVDESSLGGARFEMMLPGATVDLAAAPASRLA